MDTVGGQTTCMYILYILDKRRRGREVCSVLLLSARSKGVKQRAVGFESNPCAVRARPTLDLPWQQEQRGCPRQFEACRPCARPYACIDRGRAGARCAELVSTRSGFESRLGQARWRTVPAILFTAAAGAPCPSSHAVVGQLQQHSSCSTVPHTCGARVDVQRPAPACSRPGPRLAVHVGVAKDDYVWRVLRHQRRSAPVHWTEGTNQLQHSMPSVANGLDRCMCLCTKPLLADLRLHRPHQAVPWRATVHVSACGAEGSGAGVDCMR